MPFITRVIRRDRRSWRVSHAVVLLLPLVPLALLASLPREGGAADSAAQIMQKVETDLSTAKSYEAQLFLTLARGKDVQTEVTGSAKADLKSVRGAGWSLYLNPVAPPPGRRTQAIPIPEVQEVNDGQVTWVYLPDKNRYAKQEGEAATTSGSLLGALRKLLHVDEGKMTYAFASVTDVSGGSTVTVNGRPSYAIVATPSGPVSRWRNPRVIFGVDKATKQLNLIQAQGELRDPKYEGQKIRVTIGVQSLILNSKTLTATAFKFTPPDGAVEDNTISAPDLLHLLQP